MNIVPLHPLPTPTDKPLWQVLGLDAPVFGDHAYQGLLDAIEADPARRTWVLDRWQADRRVLVFTEEDRTTRCRYPGCRSPWNKGRLCHTHVKAHIASGSDLAPIEWAKTQEPVQVDVIADCWIEQDGIQCQRPVHTKGLCSTHYLDGRKAEAAGQQDWALTARPFEHPGDCPVLSCTAKAMSPATAKRTTLCPRHWGRWQRAMKNEGLTDTDMPHWLTIEEPATTHDHLSLWLGALSSRAVVETLCALAVQQATDVTTNLPSLRGFVRQCRIQQVETIRATENIEQSTWLVHFQTSWAKILDRLTATPDLEWEQDVIRAQVIDQNASDTSFYVGKIRQPWLRDMLVGTLRADWAGTSMSQKTNWTNAAVALSDMLWTREDNGLQVGKLGAKDIEAYVRHLTEITPSAPAVRQRLILARSFLSAAERHGLTTALRPSFAIRTNHLPEVYEEVVQPGQRALPDATFSLLCGHDPLLGHRALDLLRTIPRETADQPGLVGEVCVQVIQYAANWGRRPQELLALTADRVRMAENGAGQLRYTNFKSRREAVWLPIDGRQAQDMLIWRDTLAARYPDTPVDKLALFPAPKNNPQGTKALRGTTFAPWFRRWSFVLERAIVAAKLADALGLTVADVLDIRVSALTTDGVVIDGQERSLEATARMGLRLYVDDLCTRADTDDPPLFPDPHHFRMDDDTPSMTMTPFTGLGAGWEALASQYTTWGLPGEHLGKQALPASKVEWRRFRHTYLQHLVDAGTDIFIVQELADHADVSTTVGAYVRTRIDQLSEAVDQLAAYRINRFGVRESARSLPLVGVTDVVTNTCASPQVHSFNREGCDRGELCYGCDFFAIDPSHIPDLQAKVMTLRKSVQRFEDEDKPARAEIAREDLTGWRGILVQMQHAIEILPAAEQAQVEEAAKIVRAHRSNLRAGNLPMGSTWRST